MTLYQIRTAGCGSFYIVAETTDAAINQLTALLNESDYGTSDGREIETIGFSANEIKFIGKYASFSKGKHMLILPTTKPK